MQAGAVAERLSVSVAGELTQRGDKAFFDRSVEMTVTLLKGTTATIVLDNAGGDSGEDAASPALVEALSKVKTGELKHVADEDGWVVSTSFETLSLLIHATHAPHAPCPAPRIPRRHPKPPRKGADAFSLTLLTAFPFLSVAAWITNDFLSSFTGWLRPR